MEFSLYRVAALTEEGEYALTDDFAQYPVSLEDLDSSGLRSLAQTLDAYVARDTLTPLLSQETGEDGMVSFDGLSPGLYLVLGESYTQDNTVYTPSPMLFYLPGQGEDGGWEYEVTASCKFDQEETTDATVFRKVQKVWKDSGNQSKRPEMVFVQLLENGAVVDTVALSEENNWEYTWEGLDASSRWQVAETSVPRWLHRHRDPGGDPLCGDQHLSRQNAAQASPDGPAVVACAAAGLRWSCFGDCRRCGTAQRERLP